MKKVFVTFGVGHHQEYLELAVPGFRKFADVNNYDFLIPTLSNYDTPEPPSWKKLFLFSDLFSYYDFILWVDADIIIKKFDDDPFNYMKNDSYQGLVFHEIGSEIRPNCGVWALNKSMYDDKWIENLACQTECIRHIWWEQEANIRTMNKDLNFKAGTIQLPYKFNYHDIDNRGMTNDVMFLHAAGYDHQTRLRKMREWSKM